MLWGAQLDWEGLMKLGKDPTEGFCEPQWGVILSPQPSCIHTLQSSQQTHAELWNLDN